MPGRFFPNRKGKSAWIRKASRVVALKPSCCFLTPSHHRPTSSIPCGAPNGTPSWKTPLLLPLKPSEGLDPHFLEPGSTRLKKEGLLSAELDLSPLLRGSRDNFHCSHWALFGRIRGVQDQPQTNSHLWRGGILGAPPPPVFIFGMSCL